MSRCGACARSSRGVWRWSAESRLEAARTKSVVRLARPCPSMAVHHGAEAVQYLRTVYLMV